MQAQVLIVAPFHRLAEETQRVIAERFREERGIFKIVEADLHDAEKLVAKGLTPHTEVVVSRGGTADLLEKMLDIPVVRIQVSLTDILRAVRDSGGPETARKIGVSGFSNVIYGCEEIAGFLPTEVVEIPIRRPEEVEDKIRASLRAGVDMIVGDAVSVRIARACGVRAQPIDSGRQAICQALSEAALIAQVRRQDELKSKMLQAVINKSHDGIAAVDARGEITLFNPEAERIFRRARHEAAGHRLADYCGELRGGPAENEEAIVHIFGSRYLVKRAPVQVRDVPKGSIYTFQSISEMQRTERSVRKKLADRGLVAKWRIEDIEGESAACQKMKHKAAKYALTDSTILITGASGTGKEMLVQGIHNMSRRAKRPFLAVNCAALPESLLESELFGYAEGAFTGARKGGRQGMFELAHGGTIFLDEIAEMPAVLQSRLLRVLQEREVMPLGGESIIPVDVRVIAATNQSLLRMVQEGVFRNDLYYRLNILRIHMPSLAERRQDIPLLTKSLMRRFRQINPAIRSISDEACRMLMEKAWPGNIRQLQNMIERLMLLADGHEIGREDVLRADEDDMEDAPAGARAAAEEPLLRELTEEAVQRVLAEEQYNVSRAARRLGIHRTTLWRRLKKN